MAEKEVKYDESKIKTLSSLEHIRLRTGMYIGKIGNGSSHDDGIYILFKEVVDNAIDEFIMGYGKQIDITLKNPEELANEQEYCVVVRDYGRGIPLGKVVECVSQINTGAKYNDDVFQFSVGLNGVGTKAVNALSSRFLVESYRDGQFVQAYFERGVLKKQTKGKTTEPNGTKVSFVPDPEIFKKYKFEREFVEKRIRHYIYLNSGLTINYNGQKFYSKNGLQDLLIEELKSENIYDVISYKDKTLEYAFAHTTNYGEEYFSFVNGQYTNDGGTHLSAFKEGILKGINDYAQKNYDAVDVRDGIVGAIAIKLKNPMFESQTKNKLGNTEIRQWIVNTVKDSLLLFLNRNKETASKLIEKILLNEKIRKELNAVKKEAKAMAKKIALRIPNLRDCKYHYTDKTQEAEFTTIFITEGQSASGSMIACRDVYTQAIFSLRGKPKNCFGMPQSAIYKNEELYNIMKALDIEDGYENLRYNRIVIATDADVDGLHIRNLLLTFFLQYFKNLVLGGHIYILETPIFRVRNKNETIYCYDDVEKEEAIKKLGKSAEIT
ncbi:MAG TPA: toprim domain-containing protein, partial [bacterium]|nr:toprim domain-containing protein [bacterium]